MNIEQLLNLSLTELEQASDEQLAEWCKPFMEYVRPVETYKPAKPRATKASTKPLISTLPTTEVHPDLTAAGMAIAVQNTMLQMVMAAGQSREKAINTLLLQYKTN